MGRPLRKDVNGVDVINTFVSDSGVRVSFHDGSTVQTDGIIIKQRGAITFVVARVGTPATRFTCKIFTGTPASGEMNLYGLIGVKGSTATNLAKITKRVATDFSGNRYTWYLENDSSNDYIVLTAI
jgi:hypothetical protein